MTDVIVVGAGSAGSVVTRRLLDAGATVTLLEAGQPDENPAIHAMSRMPELWHGPDDWDYYTTPQRHANNRRLHWPRGKVLGGSHSLNAAIFVRGAHEDFDRWVDEGAAGWSWDEVLPWFRKIETFTGEAKDLPDSASLRGHAGLLDVTDVYPKSAIMVSLKQAALQAGIPDNPDYNGETIEGVGFEQITVRGQKRLSTFRAYLYPVLDNPRLTVVTGAWVHRLLLDGDRVTGVEVERDGRLEQVHADEVVLCAGALDSPRTLLLSGIGPADHLREVGIEVAHELPGVGENLHDHLLVPVICSTERPIEPAGMWDSVTQLHHFTTFRNGSPVPDTQPIYFQVPMVGDGQQPPSSAFSILAGLVRPTSRGTLRLAKSDPQERVLLDPDILATPEDMESLVASVEQCREVARQDAVAKDWGAAEVYPGPGVQSRAQVEQYVREQVVTYHHQVGTCRMGTDQMSVTDPASLRVHGLQGLRVVDASVMPSVTSGNTNAPTIMIGERGAHFILNS